MSDRLTTELIQVAAVCVAMIEDLKYGQADSERIVEPHNDSWTQSIDVLEDVGVERIRQDEKWGTRHQTPMEWLMILAEEIGEAAEEVGLLPEDTADEFGLSAEIAAMLFNVGELAQGWLEAHEWPERQQEVVDREVSDERSV